ncbi:hypothetical protein [Bradyrhizobium sp. Ai1a-2]|uniref:hypothetical protein n=1 Tax=Bradyrhizobium sp. Ai1a-2 TaxID=196490 RepID=UPI00126855DE|nr:hypothetical protein [Bradyrhizobium sp. Ai1a-2]
MINLVIVHNDQLTLFQSRAFATAPLQAGSLVLLASGAAVFQGQASRLGFDQPLQLRKLPA